MKSPKFHLREKELKAVIDADRLKFTWGKKLRAFMRDQYLPDALDHLDFHSDIDAIVKELERSVFNGSYSPSPPNRFLSEKTKGLCRQLVIPSVRDALILQCLSDALWHDIEGKAPTANSYFEPEDNSFSNNQKHEYGPYYSWLKFQKRIFKFSRERKFVVVTDIANYYDFIRYDHLRNTIAGLTDVRESVLDFLIFTLSELLWQPDYMPRVEIGLPQLNLDAPRMLAHAFLYELDRVVSAFPDCDYVRFMDDMDLGFDKIEQAKRAIKDIDLTLQSRHVRLNSGKTEILTAKDAVIHFKIRENAVLDLVGARIKSLRTKVEIARFSRKFSRYFLHAFKVRRRFHTGNGDKVLKRCLGVCGRLQIEVAPEIARHVLFLRPGCRESLFKWFAALPLRLARFNLLSDYLLSDHVVDDSSFVEFAKAVVDARATAGLWVSPTISQYAISTAGRGPYALYGSLWILSKYGSTGQILFTIKKFSELISGDYFLSRLVGGLCPRFEGTAEESEYKRLVLRLGNRAGVDALNFHYSVSSDPIVLNKIAKVVSAPSKKPNKILHSKFLLLMTINSSKTHSPKTKASLMKQHVEYKLDAVYAKLLP